MDVMETRHAAGFVAHLGWDLSASQTIKQQIVARSRHRVIMLMLT